MIILQIEHEVPNYEGWKKTFDSDPMKREESGVKNYRVSRPAGNTNYVMIELMFDNITEAKNMLSRLEKLWSAVQGKVMNNATARILEVIETKEY